MFAVIKTGGKQYRVQAGDIIEVEKLDIEEGNKVTFSQVLLVDEGGKTMIGTPYVKDARVKAEVIENFKGEKVIIFKKKRRKQYRKKIGHRQELTRVRIEEIVTGARAVSKKAAAKPAPEKKPATKLTKEAAKKETKPQTSRKKVSGAKKEKAGARTASKAVKSKQVGERKNGS
ncbi:MAG: 50S ribosomal protein L21 [Candidatus Aminicenantales bacterium]